MKFSPGAPIEIVEFETATLPKDFRGASKRIAATLRAYLKAAKSLLDGKYAGVKDLVPTHLRSDCRPHVFVFSDGILIRYDQRKSSDKTILVGRPDDDSLSQWAPYISGSFLHCSSSPAEYDPGEQVITLTFFTESKSEGFKQELFTQRIYAVAPLPLVDTSETIGRPARCVALRNDFDVQMVVGLEPDEGKPERRYLTRNRIKLPVGWEAIELYPPYNKEAWEPSVGAMWAENDILASALARNVRDDKYRALDPNWQMRTNVARLFAQFESLLSENEEPVHQFIKQNPELISPSYQMIWSKLTLGDRCTDFVFKEASGEFTLVELEKPSQRLFRKDGQQHEALTHAIDQTLDWQRYIEDNLRYVQTELGLEGITSSPNRLVVIGRDSSLTTRDRRKLKTIMHETPKLKVITYDTLLLISRTTIANIIGPFWDPGPNTELYLLPSEPVMRA